MLLRNEATIDSSVFSVCLSVCLSFFLHSYSTFAPKFARAFSVWKQARLIRNLKISVQNRPIFEVCLFFGNLTYFTTDVRSSNICRNGYTLYTTAASYLCHSQNLCFCAGDDV